MIAININQVIYDINRMAEAAWRLHCQQLFGKQWKEEFSHAIPRQQPIQRGR